ncbi:putative reverse transcriptase domain-containing protein [Tanacetum coccineum]
MIVATGQQSADMFVRIRKLELDNRRLRDIIDVASQRVTRSQRKELRVQRELRQIRHFRFYDRMWIARLEACAGRHLGYPSRTRERVNEQIDHRLAGALEARGTARNLEPLIRDEGKQKELSGNGGNGNKGNVNGGNGNGGNGNDFLKCQPLNFNGTKGVVGLRRWKRYSTLATVQRSTKDEVQKMEIELWNLAVKGNDLTSYTRRFQELVLLCTRMVPNEEDKVERFIRGLPDNIQGNVIAAEPTRLQDAIRIANNLMDQKLKGYTRSAENKIRLENNSRDNRGQQPVFKRQNVGGQNITRAYTAVNNERKGYDGSLPYCNKCKLHHAGPCTVRRGNCKRVSHITRDCTTIATPNTQRAQDGNQPGIVCYECERP